MSAGRGRHPEDVDALYSDDAVTSAKIWQRWNALPDDEPRPVHVIAAALGMTPAEVAAVVYPPETFGTWRESAEDVQP